MQSGTGRRGSIDAGSPRRSEIVRLFDGAHAISVAPMDDDEPDATAGASEAELAIPSWLNAGYYARLRQRMIEQHDAPGVAWLRERLRPGGNDERELARLVLGLLAVGSSARDLVAELAVLGAGDRLVEALAALGLLDGLDHAAVASLASPRPPIVALPPMVTAPLGARELVQALQRAGWMTRRVSEPPAPDAPGARGR